VTEGSVDVLAPENRDPQSERPNFRLQHLFVLTAVIAVMLTVSAPLHVFPAGVELPQFFRHVLTCAGISYSILSAIAITAAGYGLYWRKRGAPFLDQPGHWLLLETAITGLVGLVQQLFLRLGNAWFGINLYAPNPAPKPTTDLFFLIGVGLFSLVIIVIHLGLNIYFGRKQQERRWRSVFYLKAAALFLWAIGAVLILLRLGRVIVLDRRGALPRDGAHWCGVALQFAISGFTLLISIGSIAMFWSFFRP
jgi:hypothetical protein